VPRSWDVPNKGIFFERVLRWQFKKLGEVQYFDIHLYFEQNNTFKVNPIYALFHPKFVISSTL